MNKQIDEILSGAKTVAIIGHINPDGDCFGSISGVCDYISDTFDCTIHCFAQSNKISEEFKLFTNDFNFNPTPLEKYDVCICVDTADAGRLGIYQPIFQNSSHTICIDHHFTNQGFADINIISNVSSNCENIYYLLKSHGFKFRLPTLGKLCAGILFDTKNLTTSNVTNSSHLALAEMYDAGVDVHKIRQFFFAGNTMIQFNLLRYALNSAKFYNGNTIVIMKISKSQMKKIGATQEDIGPIIDQAFCVKNSLCALLLSPQGNEVHGSFRSKQDVDVSIIAQHFGGGGHKPAAAFTTKDFGKNDIKYVVTELSKQINNLPNKKEKIF